jgi:hypothetical protein
MWNLDKRSCSNISWSPLLSRLLVLFVVNSHLNVVRLPLQSSLLGSLNFCFWRTFIWTYCYWGCDQISWIWYPKASKDHGRTIDSLWSSSLTQFWNLILEQPQPLDLNLQYKRFRHRIYMPTTLNLDERVCISIEKSWTN